MLRVSSIERPRCISEYVCRRKDWYCIETGVLLSVTTTGWLSVCGPFCSFGQKNVENWHTLQDASHIYFVNFIQRTHQEVFKLMHTPPCCGWPEAMTRPCTTYFWRSTCKFPWRLCNANTWILEGLFCRNQIFDNTGDCPFHRCNKAHSAPSWIYTLLCYICTQCTHAFHHGSVCPYVVYDKLPKICRWNLVLIACSEICQVNSVLLHVCYLWGTSGKRASWKTKA
jgi:hypothetical protein